MDKSVQRLCKIDAWKRHAQIMQNDTKNNAEMGAEIDARVGKGRAKEHAQKKRAWRQAARQKTVGPGSTVEICVGPFY